MRTRVMPLSQLLCFRYGRALPEKRREPGTIAVVGSSGVIGSHSQPLILKPGIVVGRKGYAGNVTWVAQRFWPIDTTFYVEPQRPCNLRWAYHLLRHLRLDARATRSGVLSLSQRDCDGIIVHVPALRVQRTVAAMMDRFERATNQLHELEAAVDRVFGAIGDWMAYKAGFTGQASVAFGTLATIGGDSLPCNQIDQSHQRLPFVSVRNIESGTGRLRGVRPVIDYSPRGRVFAFSKHHLLFARIRPQMQKMAFPRRAGLCSSDIWPILPRKGVGPFWLKAVLLSETFKVYAKQNGDRSRTPKLRVSAIGDFRVPALTGGVAAAIEASGVVLDRLQRDIAKAKAELAAARQSIADRLFQCRRDW